MLTRLLFRSKFKLDRQLRIKLFMLFILIAATIYFIGTTGSFFISEAFAADHIDSPLTRTDSRKDITDIFVFRNPLDSGQLVLALNIFTPVGNPDSARLFDSNQEGEYAIFIDTNNDQSEEHTLKITFSDADGGEQEFTVNGIPGIGDVKGTVSATGEENKISEKNGAKVYAGLRDDPFFFDFEAYTSFLQAPCVPTAGLRCPGLGSPKDFFEGLNVASIVIEFPIKNLSGINSIAEGKLGVWAKTYSLASN